MKKMYTFTDQLSVHVHMNYYLRDYFANILLLQLQ